MPGAGQGKSVVLPRVVVVDRAASPAREVILGVSALAADRLLWVHHGLGPTHVVDRLISPRVPCDGALEGVDGNRVRRIVTWLPPERQSQAVRERFQSLGFGE